MLKDIVLNPKQQTRATVLNQFIARKLTGPKAATLLGLSLRHIRRLSAAFRRRGLKALLHGNQGRQPQHTRPAALRRRVGVLAQTTYAGVNHQHLTELLAERENIHLSRSSLRRWLLAQNIPSPRPRRPPKHRRRRERYPQEGLLLQIDASRHDWLQGRGPRLSLHGGIDDATGKVPAACFRLQEDAAGYFLLMRQLAAQRRLPAAVYRDRHGIFEPNPRKNLTPAEQFRGQPDPSQFGRLLRELGIHSIPARSPQAKGRIERLWATFQDRLVSELRLAHAATLAEADVVLQKFLPRFNRRFAVPATDPAKAYRPLPVGSDPQRLFCFKYLRTVAADNTVALGVHRLQLLACASRASYARAQVEVHERLDGSLAVYHRDRCVAHQTAPVEAPALRARGYARGGFSRKPLHPKPPAKPPAPQPVNARKPNPQIPAADHPWRRSFKPMVTKSLNT